MGTEERPPVLIPLCSSEDVIVIRPPDDLPEAVYDIVQVLRMETCPRPVWLAVARAYAAAGKRQLAERVLEEGTSAEVSDMLPTDNPVYAEMFLALAGAFLLDARAPGQATGTNSMVGPVLAKAELALSQAEALDFQNAKLYEAKGWLALMTGALKLAKTHFENAAQLSGAGLPGVVGLSIVLLNEQFARGGPLSPYHAAASISGRGGSNAESVSGPTNSSLVSVEAATECVRKLTTLLRTTACPPGVWLALAYGHAMIGNYSLAKAVLMRALSATATANTDAALADRGEILVALATLEANDGKADRAFEVLSMAYAHCGDSPRVVVHLAELLFYAGDLERALQLARHAVNRTRTTPNSSNPVPKALRADAHFQLARVLHRTRRFDEAQSEYLDANDEAANANAKVHPGARIGLGLLYLVKGASEPAMLPLAIEQLERVLKDTDDRDPFPRRALGVALCLSNLDVTQAALPQSAPQKNSTDSGLPPFTIERVKALFRAGLCEAGGDRDLPALVSYAHLLESFEPQEALEQYRKAIALLDDDPAAESTTERSEIRIAILNNVAALCSRLGRMEEASDSLDLAVRAAVGEQGFGEIEAKHAVLWYNTARLSELRGDATQAEQNYRSIVRSFPQHGEAMVRLGVILRNKGETEEAVKLFKIVLDRTGKDSEQAKRLASGHLATLYTQKKNYPSLQSLLESSSSLDHCASLELSAFYLECLQNVPADRKKRWLERIGKALAKVLKENPGNAMAVNGVGCYLAEDGDFQDAHEAFIAVSSHPLVGEMAKSNLAHAKLDLGRSVAKKQRENPATRMSDRRDVAVFDLAATLYEDQLIEHKTNPEYMINYACALFEARRFGEALKVIQRVIHLAPQHSSSIFNLALVLQEVADSVAEDEKSAVVVKRSMDLMDRAVRIFHLLRGASPTADGPGPAREVVDKEDCEGHYRYCRAREKKWRIKIVNLDADAKAREEMMERRRKEMELERQQREHAEKQRQDDKEREIRRLEEQSRQKEVETQQKWQEAIASVAEVDEEVPSDSDNPENGEKKRKKGAKRKRKTKKKSKADLLQGVGSDEDVLNENEVALGEESSDSDLIDEPEPKLRRPQGTGKRKRLVAPKLSDDEESDVFKSSDDEPNLFGKPSIENEKPAGSPDKEVTANDEGDDSERNDSGSDRKEGSSPHVSPKEGEPMETDKPDE